MGELKDFPVSAIGRRFLEENWRDEVCPGGCGQVLRVFVDEKVEACGNCVAERHRREREDQRRSELASGRRFRREQWSNTLASARTPDRYRQLDNRVVLDAETLAWRGDPWCVVFTGAVGVGKSSAATRLLGEIACATELRCLWLDASELIDTMFREFRASETSAVRAVDEAIAVDVLLLDDLGAVRNDGSKGAEFVQERLGFVLRQRYNWVRPTIINTDLEFSVLEERISSRLSVGIEIPLVGRDRRLA